ncbi:P-loop containing nucleoside triphosphate hydrolase protein [Xylariomycetidae sp. FL0641]|nr:P-loop containing nucleoside triphosphate hydrolase protein [Xylariomycetidae sp. FL0641]
MDSLPSLTLIDPRKPRAPPPAPAMPAPATPKPAPKPQADFRLPMSKSFSMNLAEFWKPKRASVMAWLSDLPSGPIERIEPLEPASLQSPKHGLDHDATSTSESPDDHRNKRTRVVSAPARHPGLESYRLRKLHLPGKQTFRNVSGAAKRALTGDRIVRQEVSYTPSETTAVPTPSPLLPGTPSTLVESRAKMRFVFVGDSESGKSSLLLRYYRDTFTLGYQKTQYELYDKMTQIDGQDVEAELWDTCGDVGLHQLSLLSYLSWDAVFLCFSINSLSRFIDAKTKWAKDIHQYCRGRPVFLVGLKKDLRVGTGLWAPLFPNLETRVSAADGEAAAKSLGCVEYLECSAKTGEGCAEAIEAGMRHILEERAAAAEQGRACEHTMSKGRRVSGSAAAAAVGRMFCFT